MKLEQAIAAIRFDPVLPLWLLVALAGLCLLVLAIAALRRARGVVWRALAYAAMLFWLAGPTLVQQTRATLPDIGLLVIDESASMAVGDRAALTLKARQAIEASAKALADFELRVVTVPEAGDSGTKLFTAIDRALVDIPRARLAGIVAVTDGQVHDIPAQPDWEAPLHVLIPAHGEQTDRRIRVISAPLFGIVGKTVDLAVAVEDLGTPGNGMGYGRVAHLTLRRDGEAPEIIDVGLGVETRVPVPITHAGPVVVQLTVDPLPGEASLLNNQIVTTINGVRDRLRVLLVSGEPHNGERTWRRLLKSDPAVDLVHFTILRPPEKDDMTPLNELALIAFPVRELFQVKIREFDLIILDRFSNRGLLPPIYLRNIAEYVRHGGALLMSVGPEFAGRESLAGTPLSAVLPGRPAGGVINDPFRPVTTALGMRHPVTEGLADPATPWGQWYRRLGVGAVNGDVLLTAGGAPLLVLDRVDDGRVALLLSDQIWLWSRGHDGGGPQAELLRRVAHWLMKQPELEEEALDASITAGALSVTRRGIAETPPAMVEVTDPEGRVAALKLAPTGPGRSAGTMNAPAPGVWRIADGSLVAFAAAKLPNPLEIADLRATASLLAPLARASAGSVHWLDPDGAPALRRIEPGRETSGSAWIGLQRRHDYVVSGIATLPLLPAWLALPLILGLALLAWRQEGR
jgi:hypothetical protein